MKQLLTKAIVLSRTDYGEADRIVTMLTPEQGKLRLMARGVRRIKSKLAGGIELFSISDVTYISGRGEIGTLVSARLDRHYEEIIKQLDRVQLGYELIRLSNKLTEDNPDPEYFQLLEQAFQALNKPEVNLQLIREWFNAQLLRLAGHTPNLQSGASGQKLMLDQHYRFDHDAMAFMVHERGNFMADHIKILRLLFGDYTPDSLQRVGGFLALLPTVQPLLAAMTASYLNL